MERDKNTEENVEEVEPVELLLFQVPECYVYMVNFIPALIFFLYFCSMCLYVALKHAFFVFGFLEIYVLNQLGFKSWTRTVSFDLIVNFQFFFFCFIKLFEWRTDEEILWRMVWLFPALFYFNFPGDMLLSLRFLDVGLNCIIWQNMLCRL